MSDIYWLITLSNLSTFFIIIAILSGIAIIVFSAFMLANIERDYESEVTNFKNGAKGLKSASILLLIAMLGCVFIPSEKQMYAIYGIGGVVDYVKQNDTAKQIPDKVVNYLDAWIDKQIEDENKDKSKKD